MLNLKLLLVGGAVMAAAYAAGSAAAARAGLPRGVGTDLALTGLTWFIVVARLTWIAVHPGSMAYPADVIRITQGLNTAGGIVGGAVVAAVFAARRGLDWRTVAGPAAVIGLASAAAWHATCFAHDRCGGIFAPPPLGLPLGGRSGQVPVAWVLAAAATALGWWAWRGLGDDGRSASSAGRSIVCGAIFVAVLALAGTVQLRLEPWPAAGDAGLAGVATLLAGLAALARRKGPVSAPGGPDPAPDRPAGSVSRPAT